MKLSLDFAFEGFRIVRQRPIVILFWGLVCVVCGGISLYITMTMAGDAQFQAQKAIEAGDWAGVMTASSEMAPASLLSMPFSTAMQAIVSCAVFRLALRDDDLKAAGLKLGLDELRQAVVAAAFLIMSSLASIACTLLAALFSAALGTFLGAFGAVIGVLVGAGLFIWLITRLSLAPVQSFAEQRINFFGSWNLTKGQETSLLSGYLVALILAGLVYLLCTAVLVALSGLINSGDLSALTLEESEVAADRNPTFIFISLVINLIVTPLLMAIAFGAPAAAYKRLTADKSRAENIF